MSNTAAVLDTNVFVAAGFNEDSHSAALMRAASNRKLLLMWDEDTLRETQAVLERIPPLDWGDFEDLFRPEYLVPESQLRRQFIEIPDRGDRKFASLADRAAVPLITNDDHLLAVRDSLDIAVMTPRQATQELHLTSD